VGIFDFAPSGSDIYHFLRGPVCHYWIAIHHPAVYSGIFIDSKRLYYRSENIQMIGGFVHPGKPMANMYFVLYGYSECYTPFGHLISVVTRFFFVRLSQSGPTITARFEDRSV
jgi:hypothetical protein